MGPRILLTGARGFAGTHFRSCLEARLPGHVLLDGSMDIRDRAAVERFVRSEKPDACLHLAAESSGDNACKWTVNLDGTMNLIETFRLYASEARFVFVSTAEVYGASFASAQSLDETAALAPVSSFAASRAAADMAIGTFSAVGLQGFGSERLRRLEVGRMCRRFCRRSQCRSRGSKLGSKSRF